GPRGGAAAHAAGGGRRGVRAAGAVGLARPLPAHAGAAPARAPVRGRRTARRRAAARRAGPPSPPARRRAAPEPVGAHGAARRGPLLLADRHPAAARPARRAGAGHGPGDQPGRPGAGGRRAARRVVLTVVLAITASTAIGVGAERRFGAGAFRA